MHSFKVTIDDPAGTALDEEQYAALVAIIEEAVAMLEIPDMTVTTELIEDATPEDQDAGEKLDARAIAALTPAGFKAAKAAGKV